MHAFRFLLVTSKKCHNVLKLISFIHNLRLCFGHHLSHFRTNCRLIGQIAKVSCDLAIDVFVACFFEVGLDDFLGVGVCRVAVFAHQVRGPKAEQFVAARFSLELHLAVMGKLVFECVFAVVERGHQKGLPVWCVFNPDMRVPALLRKWACTKRTAIGARLLRATCERMPMARRKKIYEGKAKILYEGPEPGTIVQYFKDDATAFNAEKKDVIEGKGVLNNRLSEFFMTGLNYIGVPTHFIKRLNMREQLVRQVEIVPLEVIVRNYAAGTMSKRLGIEEGTQLPRPIVEYCYKDDSLGDPLVTEEHIAAFGWASQQDMDDILSLALRVNDYLSGLMYGVGIRLVDFKIEIGRVYDGDFQRLIVADEISPDSCRLWDIETNQKLDKDVFRRDLGSLTDAYTEVAKRLGVMPKNATPITKPTLIN